MITTTHMLMAAVATTRPRMPGWMVLFGWLGGLCPDLPMIAMALIARIGGSPVSLWRRPDGLYWSDPWKTLIDYAHSLPLWTALCLIGWMLLRRGGGALAAAGQTLLVFAAGALIHAGADFFVHTDDAHAQWLPFSDWRFHSPVSYYQREHFGREVALVELGFCLFAVWCLLRAFRSRTVRLVSLLMLVPVVLHTGLIILRGLPA